MTCNKWKKNSNFDKLTRGLQEFVTYHNMCRLPIVVEVWLTTMPRYLKLNKRKKN